MTGEGLISFVTWEDGTVGTLDEVEACAGTGLNGAGCVRERAKLGFCSRQSDRCLANKLLGGFTDGRLIRLMGEILFLSVGKLLASWAVEDPVLFEADRAMFWEDKISSSFDGKALVS